MTHVHPTTDTARVVMTRIGATRACPDCGRPQHYTGTECGWAHDALTDTWHCYDPSRTHEAGE